MIRFPMRYLLFSLIFCTGCVSDYKALRPSALNSQCVEKLRPRGVKTSWYTASIDVIGKHLSGLLLIKDMQDSTRRIVFTNEAGIKFFDLEFASDGRFKVHQVIRQMDRKPVIRLLQKDFALLLGLPFRNAAWQAWEDGNNVFYGVTQKKETHYFITGKDCASLQRIESGSESKRKTTIQFYGADVQRPDSIYLQHYTFDMQIKLRKLAKE